MDKLTNVYMLFVMFLFAPYMLITKDGWIQVIWIFIVVANLVWLHLVEIGMRQEKEIFYIKAKIRELGLL